MFFREKLFVKTGNILFEMKASEAMSYEIWYKVQQSADPDCHKAQLNIFYSVNFMLFLTCVFLQSIF